MAYLNKSGVKAGHYLFNTAKVYIAYGKLVGGAFLV